MLTNIKFAKFIKGGVDTVDHCIEINTCRRKTNRWTLNVFYYMIDVSVQNAFKLATLTNETPKDILRLRQTWIEKLGLDLILKNVEKRHESAVKEKWKGRSLKHRQNLEEFLEKVKFELIRN